MEDARQPSCDYCANFSELHQTASQNDHLLLATRSLVWSRIAIVWKVIRCQCRVRSPSLVVFVAGLLLEQGLDLFAEVLHLAQFGVLVALYMIIRRPIFEYRDYTAWANFTERPVQLKSNSSSSCSLFSSADGVYHYSVDSTKFTGYVERQQTMPCSNRWWWWCPWSPRLVPMGWFKPRAGRS